MPLFLPEPKSDRVQRWIERQADEVLSISESMLPEFQKAVLAIGDTSRRGSCCATIPAASVSA
jgi:hypothetical protein